MWSKTPAFKYFTTLISKLNRRIFSVSNLTDESNKRFFFSIISITLLFLQVIFVPTPNLGNKAAEKSLTKKDPSCIWQYWTYIMRNSWTNDQAGDGQKHTHRYFQALLDFFRTD